MSQVIKDKLALNYSSKITVTDDKEGTADIALTEAPATATAIVGQITSNGQPFQGATVKLFTDPNANTPYQHTITDEKGNYSFAPIESGTFYAAAVAEGFILSPHVEVKVTDSAIGVANIIITPTPSLLLGSISGTVTDANGPINNVLVTLTDITTGEIVAVTTTIDDGEYAFYDLINNNYSLLFVKSRYYPRKENATISDAKKINNIDTKLKANTEVRKATISGIITNEGIGVPEGFIGLYKVTTTNGITAEELVAVTKSNTAGQYLFINLNAGTYVVKAKKYNL